MSDDPPSKPPAQEPTVKEYLEAPEAHSDSLDPETLAELQRWFGLPSAMDLPPEEPPPAHEVRRAAALAAVEPWFLAYLQRHSERLPLMFEEISHQMVLNESFVTVAERYESTGHISEPREIEIPYQLSDDLKETVPQALLRDLHRPEEYFHRYLELTKVSDGIPDVRLQIAAAIAAGEAERQVPSARDELVKAIQERVEARHIVPWESLSRAVQSDPASDGERDPSS